MRAKKNDDALMKKLSAHADAFITEKGKAAEVVAPPSQKNAPTVKVEGRERPEEKPKVDLKSYYKTIYLDADDRKKIDDLTQYLYKETGKLYDMSKIVRSSLQAVKGDIVFKRALNDLIEKSSSNRVKHLRWVS